MLLFRNLSICASSSHKSPFSRSKARVSSRSLLASVLNAQISLFCSHSLLSSTSFHLLAPHSYQAKTAMHVMPTSIATICLSVSLPLEESSRSSGRTVATTKKNEPATAGTTSSAPVTDVPRIP